MKNKETLEEADEIAKFAEKKYLKRLDNFEKVDFKDGVFEGAKWQQERSYSEEEVKQMLIDCCGEVSCEDGTLMGKTPVELYKWIDKQFKKK